MTVIILLVVVIVLIAINIVVSFTKKSKDSTAEIKTQLIKIDSDLSKIDPLIRDEFGRNREENQRASKDNREELNTSFKLLSETLTKTVTDLSNAQKNQFETYSKNPHPEEGALC